jgi:hypothetical protein
MPTTFDLAAEYDLSPDAIERWLREHGLGKPKGHLSSKAERAFREAHDKHRSVAQWFVTPHRQETSPLLHSPAAPSADRSDNPSITNHYKRKHDLLLDEHRKVTASATRAPSRSRARRGRGAQGRGRAAHRRRSKRRRRGRSASACRRLRSARTPHPRRPPHPPASRCGRRSKRPGSLAMSCAARCGRWSPMTSAVMPSSHRPPRPPGARGFTATGLPRCHLPRGRGAGWQGRGRCQRDALCHLP